MCLFKGYVWEQRKLKNITTKIGSGQTPHGGEKVYKQSGTIFLRSQNINSDRVILEDVRYIDNITNNKMKNSIVNQGDVLLNITGASIGRSAVYNYSMKANVNQHVCIIRLKNKSVAKFLQILLASEKGQQQIRINQAGGGREGLNFQQISTFKFLFPSDSEINRITKLILTLEGLIAHHQRH